MGGGRGKKGWGRRILPRCAVLGINAIFFSFVKQRNSGFLRQMRFLLSPNHRCCQSQTLKERAVDLQTRGLSHLEQSPAVKPLSFGDLGTSLSVHFSSLLSFPLVSQYLLPRVQFLWMLKISRGCFYIPSCKDITILWGLEGEGRGVRT